MDTSMFLAKLLGLYFFLIGLAMLLNLKRFKDVMKKWEANSSLLMHTDAIWLFIGLVLVIIHSYWEPHWGIIVTLACWFIMLKAAYRLFFFDPYIKFMKKSLEHPSYNWCSWVFLVVGAYLGIVGFFEPVLLQW